jgi:hypothetical protein
MSNCHVFFLLLPGVCLQNAVRGQGVLRVSNTSVFTPGQWVRLVMDAPAAGGIVTNMTQGIVPESADYK